MSNLPVKHIKITVITEDDKEEDIFDRDVTEVSECKSIFGVYEMKVNDTSCKFLTGNFEFLIQGKIEELCNQTFETIQEIKE